MKELLTIEEQAEGIRDATVELIDRVATARQNAEARELLGSRVEAAADAHRWNIAENALRLALMAALQVVSADRR